MKAALKTNRFATLVILAFVSITFLSTSKVSAAGPLDNVSSSAWNLVQIGKRIDILMDKALQQVNLSPRQYGDLEKLQSDLLNQAQFSLSQAFTAGQLDVIAEAQNTFSIAQDLNNRIQIFKNAVRANPFNFGTYLVSALDVKTGSQNLVGASTNLFKASEKANG